MFAHNTLFISIYVSFMSVLEAIFHGWLHIEVTHEGNSIHVHRPDWPVCDVWDTFNIDYPSCGWILLHIWEYTVYHASNIPFSEDIQEIAAYTPDVAFLSFWGDWWFTLEESIRIASLIDAKYVAPLYTRTWWKSQDDLLEFARRVLLDNYAVPRILRPWQAVVVSK